MVLVQNTQEKLVCYNVCGSRVPNSTSGIRFIATGNAAHIYVKKRLWLSRCFGLWWYQNRSGRGSEEIQSLSLPCIETQPSIHHASVVYLTASNFTDWPVVNKILLFVVMVVLFEISSLQTAADRPNNEAVTYPISLFSRVSILAFHALVSFLSRRTRIAGKSWYAQFSLFTWLSWWTSLSSRPLKTLSKKMLLPTEQVKASAGIYLLSLSFSLQCCWNC